MRLEHLTAISAAIIVAIVLAAVFKGRKEKRYVKQNYLLTKNEYLFYQALLTALQGSNLTICPKVRLGDLVSVPGKHDAYWKSKFGQIAQKHIDFVLCQSNGLKPVLLIELDDKSHKNPDNAARDRIKDECCKEAGVELLRVKSRKNYQPNEIKEQIKRTLNICHE